MNVSFANAVISLLFIGVALGSLAVWLPIAVRLNNYGMILPYEPRRRVPWGPMGAFPAILLVVTTVAFALWIGASPDQLDLEPDDVVRMLIGRSIEFAVLTSVFAVVVILQSGATARDLGVPSDGVQWRSDIFLGVAGWLACLIPVFGVQLILISMFKQTSQNPVIKLVEEHPEWPILATAFFSAVVVAPICEEFVFRVLLQGWLERVEDALIGAAATYQPNVPVAAEVSQTNVDIIEILPDDSDEAGTPLPPRPLYGIPRGAIPILVSSFTFSLAHFGNGPDPVAIFLLALFLGYLYQRTHRIVPSMVVHMLFNGLSLVLLWLSLMTERP